MKNCGIHFFIFVNVFKLFRLTNLFNKRFHFGTKRQFPKANIRFNLKFR